MLSFNYLQYTEFASCKLYVILSKYNTHDILVPNNYLINEILGQKNK